MQLPAPPTPQQIEAISPTLYEAATACKAKAVWARFGNRQYVIDAPNALIGTAFHKVMEWSASGRLPEGETARATARQVFDEEAQRTFERAHPLLRSKYSTRSQLPNYFLQRERAVAAALHLPRPATRPPSSPAATVPQGLSLATEQTLTSSDGKLKGKIDWLNTSEHEIVDYKAGIVPDGQSDQVSDRERRQLCLYAYLARQHGADIQRGTIIRSNGKRCSVPISPHEPETLADEARAVLLGYNHAVEAGHSFNDMAQPSKEACWFCPCIPFCTKFWETNKNGWSDFQGFGWHIQGTVSQVSNADLQGLRVITMKLNNCSGTDIPSGTTLTIEQVPVSWICSDAEEAPKAGDIIRIVHARKSHAETQDVFRADKALSTVWQVPV